MAKKWLDNVKKKASDWYYDGDQFYLRTIVDPFIELCKNIANSGQQVSEYVTPVYSDIKAGADMLEGGVNDLQQGSYLNGIGKMAASVPLSVVSLLALDGLDVPIKATAARMSQPLEVYTAKTLGGKAGRGRPASNINDATGKPITMGDIIDAIKNNGKTVYENTSEEAIESMVKRQVADKEAGYHAAIQAMDKKLARKKDPSEATRINIIAKRQGISPDQSVYPKVTTYLQETLASGFTPSKKALIKGDVDLAYQEWIDYLTKLKYDTKSKDSVKALNQIAEETWMKSFQSKKKQGGILNYSTYFS